MSGLPDELTQELEEIGEDIDTIFDDLVTDSETMNVFTDKVSQTLVFFGKSLALWEDEMWVGLPDTGTPTGEEFREIFLDLANKVQIASHYHELASPAHLISMSNISVKKSDLITALISHYHATSTKAPPAAILEKMADGFIARLSNLGNTTKIVKQFWRNKLDTLEKVRVLVNSMAISIAVQNKSEGSGGDD